jgi:hypothetical protein
MSKDTEKSICKGNHRSRESFVKTLTKIFMRIDARQVYEVSWKLFRYANEQDDRCKFILNKVWVVGSFARGAISCGDLDLVVKIDVLSGFSHPSASMVAKSSIGRFPDLSVYLGTPDDNSSGVAFPESVLLWSKDDISPSWQKRIESISVDENATRFSREYDSLPFRTEQICRGNLESIDKIVSGLKSEKIVSQWVSMEDLIRVAPDSRSESLLLRIMRDKCGEQTVKVFQSAIPWMSLNLPILDWQPEYAATELWVGGCRLHTGPSPYVPLHWLNRLAFSTVCLMPHITRRGPNGLWIFRRGPKHQLVKKFESAVANVVCDVSGSPEQRITFNDELYPKFRTGIKIHKKPGKKTRPFTGLELLTLISQVGALSIGRKVFPVNQFRYESGYDERIMKILGLEIG